ncbi:hypothetical protein D9M69_524520 [compost metagenome]
MLRLSRIAQAGGQVRRPDEDPVHAIHRDNRVQVFQGLAGLGLHQEAQLILAAAHIVVYPAITCGAHAATDASHAARRIAHAGHGALGFGGILYVGQQQGLCADVQVLLDLDLVVPRGAHDGMAAVGGRGL